MLQFGNQQNRQADNRNYARAEKRRKSRRRLNPFFPRRLYRALPENRPFIGMSVRKHVVFPEAPDDHHHDPEPVPEVNNALDRYPQAARHEKIADLFYNPGRSVTRDQFA